MEFFKKTTQIDFMGQRKLALIFSIVLLAVSIGSMATRGLNWGLDFTGGTLVEVMYEQDVEIADVRANLAEGGFPDAVVQVFGNPRDLLIRIPPKGDQSSDEISALVIASLEADGAAVEERRVEYVGPQVGDELTNDGGLAMIYALAMIMLYIIIRFQWKFSVGAVLALVHDVIIVLGMFSLFQFAFDLVVLAALLAVIGYSLNDTIVVYDRIRENFRNVRKAVPIEIFNLSINQMLARTLMTSLTTLLVLIALYVFGGEVMAGFATALIIGVLIGTYSSVYVAGSALTLLDVSKEDLMPPQKEGEEFDAIP